MFSHPEFSYVFDSIPTDVVNSVKQEILQHGLEATCRLQHNEEEINNLMKNRSKDSTKDALIDALLNNKVEVSEKLKGDIIKYGIETTTRLRGRKTEDYRNLQIAGRLLIFDLRRTVSPSILGYIEDMKDRLQPKYYEFIKTYHKLIQDEIDKSTPIVYENNDYFSFSCCREIYLAKMSYDEVPAEIPEYLYVRVAVQLFWEDGIERVLQCYKEQLNFNYTLASPTLFNSCMHKNSLSSCYIGRMEDDLHSILLTGADFGMISKGCGAFGIDISLLRESSINGGVGTSDIVKWLQILDATAIACDQEKKRPGSVLASIRPHHIGLEKVVNALNKVGDRYETAHHINISIFTCRLFWQRVRTRSNWTLFCPAKTKELNNIDGVEFTQVYEETEKRALELEEKYQQAKELYESANKYDYDSYRTIHLNYLESKKNRIPFKVVNAYDLLIFICKIQRMTGQPFINNGDAINFKFNMKKIARCNNCNLCQEITLPSSFDAISSCNLGSICQYKFVTSKIDRDTEVSLALRRAFDFDRYGLIVRSMVDNLNSVIDYNRYPLDTYDENGKAIPGKIHKPNIKYRPIGLGVQGFAETLYSMDLCIEDDKDYVKSLNLYLFACMYFNALVRSVELAMQHGPHHEFDKTMLAEGKFQFDLWKDELDLIGSTPNNIRLKEPEIITPDQWGQQRIMLSNGDYIDPSWNDLRRCIMKYGVYNSMLITLMPTASSSQILRSTESVEMPNSNLYSRVLVSGNYTVLNRFMVSDMEEIGLWNEYTHDYLKYNNGSIKNIDKFVNNNPDLYKEFTGDTERLSFLIKKYKTMWEISQKYMIQLMAERSRYICHSASLNLYLSDPTDEQLVAALMYGYDSGLKTIMYYLRQRNSSEALKTTIRPEIQKLIQNCFDISGIKTPEESKVLVCTRENKDCISCQG